MLSRRPGFNMLVPAHTQLNTLTHTSMCHKWICNIHSAQFMFFEAQCCGLMSSYVCQKFERERERESEACLIAAEDELVASNTTLRSLKTDSKFAIIPKHSVKNFTTRYHQGRGGWAAFRLVEPKSNG